MLSDAAKDREEAKEKTKAAVAAVNEATMAEGIVKARSVTSQPCDRCRGCGNTPVIVLQRGSQARGLELPGVP